MRPYRFAAKSDLHELSTEKEIEIGQYVITMTLFKCQMYLARTALIGDTFQIELEFRNVGF